MGFKRYAADPPRGHWADDYLLTARTRHCLLNFFPTEDSLRAAWPITPGDFPHLGRSTITEIAETLGLPDC